MNKTSHEGLSKVDMKAVKRSLLAGPYIICVNGLKN